MLDETGRCVEGFSGCLGRATNNVAEYSALIEALKLAAERGAREVDLVADSELIVRQIHGIYRVKNPSLKPLFAEAVRRIGGFASFSIRHVRREENKDADRLVNQALDRAEAEAAEATPAAPGAGP